MKTKLKLKLNTFLTYGFLILVTEIIFKLFVFHRIGFTSLIYTMIFSLPIVFFLTILTNIFKAKISRIIYYSTLVIITLLYEFQYVFYKLFSVFFSFHTIGLAGQAADFKNIIVDSIKMYYAGIISILLPLIIVIVLKKYVKFYEFRKKNLYTILILFVVSIGISYLSLVPGKSKLYSANSLYFKVNDQEKTIDKFGLITAMRIDVKRVLFGFEEKLVSNGGIVEDKPGKQDPEKPITYNQLDIDFEALKANESNSTVKNLYDYFAKSSPSKQNDYTGYFKGKNLIFILAEGFNSIAVSEELTPTLYKMVNSSFVFNNYYSPVFLSTTGGEFQATTGLIPTQEILKVWKSKTPKMSYALGHQFNKLGYDVNAFHDWTYSYYQRDKTMPTLGYSKYLGCKNGLEKEISCRWLPSDIDMMEVTVPKYSSSEHFMTYYISVSGHAPYNFGGGNSIAKKNKSLVSDLPYDDAARAYIATQIEFDRSIERLIKKLEEAGKLDDTVIVITGDHYPYTLTNDEVNSISSYKRDGVVEINRSNLIIWNNQMTEPVVVDKVGSQIDVLPTILNLFGIEYDSRLIIGKDILSDYPGLAVFANRSWVSDKGTYYSQSKKFEPREGVEVDDSYVKNMNVEVANRFTISGQITNNNIYKKILGD